MIDNETLEIAKLLKIDIKNMSQIQEIKLRVACCKANTSDGYGELHSLRNLIIANHNLTQSTILLILRKELGSEFDKDFELLMEQIKALHFIVS